MSVLLNKNYIRCTIYDYFIAFNFLLCMFFALCFMALSITFKSQKSYHDNACLLQGSNGFIFIVLHKPHSFISHITELEPLYDSVIFTSASHHIYNFPFKGFGLAPTKDWSLIKASTTVVVLPLNASW